VPKDTPANEEVAIHEQMQPWLKSAAETSVAGVRSWNLQTVCGRD